MWGNAFCTSRQNEVNIHKRTEARVLFWSLLLTEERKENKKPNTLVDLEDILSKRFVCTLTWVTTFSSEQATRFSALSKSNNRCLCQTWGTSERLWGEFGFHSLKVIWGGLCFSGLPLPANLAAEGWTTQLSVLWGNHLPHQLHHSTLRKSFISNLHPSLLTKEWKPKHRRSTKIQFKSVRYDTPCGRNQFITLNWFGSRLFFVPKNAKTRNFAFVLHAPKKEMDSSPSLIISNTDIDSFVSFLLASLVRVSRN